DPTCTENGYTTYTCSVCGDSYTADEVTTNGHSYDAVVTDPTCTENGYTTYTCSICGDSYTADEVMTNGHSYDAVVTDPTCTENGYTTYTCSVCGDSYTADEVTTNGHSYDAVVTDPTCTENGYTTYTCSVCGDSYTADEVNATGHADENEDYKCDACSTVLEPAADSTLTVAQAVKLANALGIGKYSTNKYYMTVIIESIYNTQYGNANVKDANGDKYVIYGMYLDGTRYDKLTYKPVAGDEVTFYAAVGSYSSSSYQMKSADIIEIVAHEHAYTSVVTEPTCTADGYTTHTCSICQASYTDAETVATGHSTEEGVCEYCGKTIGGDAPAEPEVLATFDFGANGTATHADGSDLGASTSYTVGSYTLSLTSMSKVYGPAYDAMGNSCLKLGTGKVVGTFTFTVPENVSTVYIYVAKYKANTTKITINGGTAQTLTCASNNGEYDKIEVDTSTNKNVTFATASGGLRAMVNTIEFVGLPA
ncbi:MAG: hypothetical protein J6K86_04915, partial [Clostridia bacterium]|nr:hypothetical protein [Clostridia bacterium]